MTDSSIGLYLHIPFCEKKCAYCDFYSAVVTEKLLDLYVKKLIDSITEWGGKESRPVSAVYFGGGTPSLLGGHILPIMQAVRNCFSLADNAEITLEINPTRHTRETLLAARKAGVNRLSIGAQSGRDSMLSLLGRQHTAKDTLDTVALARKLGFRNLSLDLMLGLPFSDLSALKQDMDFLLSAEPEHLSAYLLTIEPNTLFDRKRDALDLPDEERQAEQYLALCERLKSEGYRHYEISNFCRDGFESRHNLLYWRCREYLGVGPSAHSFLNGKRFYYPRDLKAFLRGNSPVFDEFGGSAEEYAMLTLRLAEGLRFSEYEKRFGKRLDRAFFAGLAPLEKEGLLTVSNEAVSLTDRGMMVSNSVITEILNDIERSDNHP